MSRRASIGLAVLAAIAMGCSRRSRSGATIWELRKGGDLESGEAQSVAVDAEGNVYAAWTYRGTVDFGGGPLPSACSEGRLPTDLAVAKFSAAGAHLWSKRFACVSDVALAVDPSGALVMAGDVQPTTDFGGGPLLSSSGVRDVFVAKLDRAGKHVWSKRFPAGNHAAVKTVSVDASGAIALGGAFHYVLDFGDGAKLSGAFSNTGNLFVVKLDPNGKHVFSRAFETNAWQRSSVAFTPAGDLLFAGSISGPVDFGTGKLAGGAFVAKFDKQGNTVRAKTFGKSEATTTQALSVSPDGDAFVAGVSSGVVDFGSGPVCSEGRSHAGQAWVVRFDDTGVARFARCFQGREVVVWGAASNASSVVVVGKLMGGAVDFGGGALSGDGAGFVLMLDEAGMHRYSRRVGANGELDENLAAVALDRAGSATYAGAASHVRGAKFFHSLLAARLSP